MAAKSVYRETNALLKKAERLEATPEEKRKGKPFGDLPWSAFGTRMRIRRVDDAIDLQHKIIRLLDAYEINSRLPEEKRKKREELQGTIDFDKEAISFMRSHEPVTEWRYDPKKLRMEIKKCKRQRKELLGELKILHKFDKLILGPDGEREVSCEEFGKLVGSEQNNLKKLKDYRATLVDQLKGNTGFKEYVRGIQKKD